MRETTKPHQGLRTYGRRWWAVPLLPLWRRWLLARAMAANYTHAQRDAGAGREPTGRSRPTLSKTMTIEIKGVTIEAADDVEIAVDGDTVTVKAKAVRVVHEHHHHYPPPLFPPITLPPNVTIPSPPLPPYTITCTIGGETSGQ